MPVHIAEQKTAPLIRQVQIPTDLSYMTETDFGREMMRLAEEIMQEQGTRTTDEINHLIELMRGGAASHAGLP